MDLERKAECSRDDLAGDVVGGRAQPPGKQDHLGLPQRRLELGEKVIVFVSDHDL